MTIKSGRLDGAEGWIVREQKLRAEIERLTRELAEATNAYEIERKIPLQHLEARISIAEERDALPAPETK